MDGLGVLRPVDAGDVALPGALVGHVFFDLLVAGGLAGLDQFDGFGHRFDAEREEVVAVDGVDRRVGLDRAGALEQDRAGVEALVDPEDGDAGHRVALQDGVVDGGAAAVLGQDRGVVLDRLERREFEHPRGDDLGHERHHVEVRRGCFVLRDDFIVDDAAALPAARLVQRDAGVAGGLGERVGPPALALGRGEDADDLVAVGGQPLENRRAERRLPDQCDPHRALPELSGRPRFAWAEARAWGRVRPRRCGRRAFRRAAWRGGRARGCGSPSRSSARPR